MNRKYSSFGIFNDKLALGPARWEHFDLIFIHDGHLVFWPGTSRQLELKSRQSILIYPETDFHGYSVPDSTRVSVHHFSIMDTNDLPEAIAVLKNRKNGYKSFLTLPDRQVERDIERLVNLKQAPQRKYLDTETASALMLLILLGVL